MTNSITSVWLAGWLLAAAGTAFADLAAVKAEPNLEKRSDQALENADHGIDAARKAYQAGDSEKMSAILAEVRESVALSFESLEQTGKKPRSSPKYFKRAELKTRKLARRLADFKQEVGIDDRPIVEKVEQEVQEIHDRLLTGIMGKRK